MKRYFPAHCPLRKIPSLLKVLSVSNGLEVLSLSKRLGRKPEGLEPALSPEPVEEIEEVKRAHARIHPASMPNILQKGKKHPHFGSFLSVEKCLKYRINATQSATNPLSPAILNAKSPKVGKNNPMARAPRIEFKGAVRYLCDGLVAFSSRNPEGENLQTAMFCLGHLRRSCDVIWRSDISSVKFLNLIPIFLLGSTLLAQRPAVSPSPDDSALTPTWETQKQARTYLLSIPAPRGQITDRNGNPLAQTRVSYNLAINFPTPLKFTDPQVLAFAHEQIGIARGVIGRSADAPDEQILKHYHNRGVLPLEIAQDLLPQELERFKAHPQPNLSLEAVYLRFYPDGILAGHILGYAGKNGRQLEKTVENNDLLWPETEGREGLELTFNSQLTGKVGQMNIAIDATGRKVSEKVAIPPVPGYTVVTTIDENLQRLCEQTLAKSAKRGAIVIIDPDNGDILAMASWPVFNPNVFVPTISEQNFNALRDDPQNPLLPRAYRSAYPPGSTFKVFVGIAALESGAISLHDQFPCPGSMEVGNITFHNWKKGDAGSLDFHEALEQSCDTWFYQVGIKTGAKWVTDWAFKCGFGFKTGIPLRAEAEGRIPTDDYMKKVYGRKLLNGDMANMSIGQGDTLVTPLQMAQAMAAVGNGGTMYKPRLVKQVQSIENQIITAYDVRAKSELNIAPTHMAELKKAMVDVVTGGSGTAHKAAVENVQMAGKTGTAQWGPKKKERNAAWFAGFVPADKPKFAFAAVYEGEIGQSTHGGDFAAPMIGKIMREIFKDQSKSKKKAKSKPTPTPKDDDAPTNAD